MSKTIKRYSLAICFILTFGLAMADGLTGYIQSSFLSQVLGLETMSLTMIVATIATITASLSYPIIIKRLGNYQTALLASFLALTSTLAMSLSTQALVIFISFILRYTALILLAINLDVFLEATTSANNTGSIRSRFLTVLNLAWILSPTIAGKLSNLEGLNLVYKASFIALCFFIVALLIVGKKLKQPKHIATNVKFSLALKKLLANRDLKIIFGSSLVLQIFYAMAVLYVPIRLSQELGMNWQVMGMVFTVMLLPFILFEYPAGVLADRKFGEKEMLIIGNIVTGLACIVMSLIDTSSGLVWALVLFGSRSGAAISETMQETYFYKKIDAEDVELITLFRQSKSIGWLAGTSIASAYLMFWPLKNLFIILAILLLFNIISVFKMKDTL